MANPTLTSQDAEMHSGDDKLLRFTVKTQPANVAKNIAGATIKWQLSKKAGAAALLTKQTGGSGIVITDGANGIFEVTLAQADTAGLKGTYYHEAEVTDSGGSKGTVAFGTFVINTDQIT